MPAMLAWPWAGTSKATLLVKVAFVERDARVLPDMSAKIGFLSRSLAADERKPVPAVRPDAIAEALRASILRQQDAPGAAITENAVALVKSAVAAANNAFESVQKAAKQATEVAEANFTTLTNQAVKASQTATKSKKAA